MLKEEPPAAAIAEAAKAADAKMVYLSTDYVFDGQGERPWQPDDKNYAPLNFYGQTKLEGELAVSKTLEKYFIVRIAWVYGLNGKNFINQIRVQAVPHFISFFLVNFICSVFIQCSLPNPIHCVCLCLRQQSRPLSAKCFPVHFHCIAALSA